MYSDDLDAAGIIRADRVVGHEPRNQHPARHPRCRTGGGAVADCWADVMSKTEKIISGILWGIAILLTITQLI